VRALFVTGGNPLFTMPNSERLREAFEKLELLVCLDIFRCRDGELAHYVLPCTSPLQRPDLPFIFPLMLGLQRKPYLQATRAVVPPEGEQRDEATIYLDLCRASGVSTVRLEASRSARSRGSAPGALASSAAQTPSRAAAGGAARRSAARDGSGRLRRAAAAPARPAAAPTPPATFLGARVVTDDGKVHLAPPTC
jgi:anaerobic selenocysteine-containing dehydrogenase